MLKLESNRPNQKGGGGESFETEPASKSSLAEIFVWPRGRTLQTGRQSSWMISREFPASPND